MSAATFRDRLQALTDEAVELLASLSEVLNEEAAALRRRKLEAISTVTDIKLNLIRELEGRGHELMQLFHAAGIKPDPAGLRDSLDTPELVTSWEHMQRLLRECGIKNRINGGVIELSRSLAENLLQVLQGDRAPARTYGKSGRIHHDSTPQAIAKA